MSLRSYLWPTREPVSATLPVTVALKPVCALWVGLHLDAFFFLVKK